MSHHKLWEQHYSANNPTNYTLKISDQNQLMTVTHWSILLEQMIFNAKETNMKNKNGWLQGSAEKFKGWPRYSHGFDQMRFIFPLLSSLRSTHFFHWCFKIKRLTHRFFLRTGFISWKVISSRCDVIIRTFLPTLVYEKYWLFGIIRNARQKKVMKKKTICVRSGGIKTMSTSCDYNSCLPKNFC